jgi:hypothetical protein
MKASVMVQSLHLFPLPFGGEAGEHRRCEPIYIVIPDAERSEAIRNP